MHGDLTQSDTFERAGVLAAGADAVGRGLRVPGLVRDQHHFLTYEFTHDQAGNLLPGPVMVEPRP